MPNDADRAGTPAGVFGAELRFYRTRAGLSQKDLAAGANVSHDVISKIETGERPPAEDFPPRHGPPASSTSIRRRSWPTSTRSVNVPACREALCSTALVANSEVTRIASSASGHPPSHPASAARATLTCPASAG